MFCRIDKNIDASRLSTGNRDFSKDVPEIDSDFAAEFAKAMEPLDSDKEKEPPALVTYMQNQVQNAFHAPLSTLLKGAVIMTEDLFIDILPVAWELLLETNQEVAAAAASMFIAATVRAPTHASEILHQGLHHEKADVRINAILKFQVLWRFRYQVWQRMEEAAHITFKVPPPGIEFTLPSPRIGIESLPVVDPPWMPQVKTKVEEITINRERHVSIKNL